ncbi:MAG: hypothetical protein U9O65_07505 [Thermotogota bacterium]|nr:hypothetical protein [Thermotogota bacterium]
MKKIVVIIFMIFPLLTFGATIRAGIEGPAILGATIETDGGLYISLGASPPLSIFGSGGPWSYSVTAGYAHPIALSTGKKINFFTVPRIGVSFIKPDNLYIGVIPGIIGAIGWNANPVFTIGLQVGVNICLLLEINSMKPNLVPTGQFGIFTTF